MTFQTNISTRTDSTPGPFSGILVVDLTHVLNGPFGGYDDPTVRVGAPELDQHGAALRREFASSTQLAAE